MPEWTFVGIRSGGLAVWGVAGFWAGRRRVWIHLLYGVARAVLAHGLCFLAFRAERRGAYFLLRRTSSFPCLCGPVSGVFCLPFWSTTEEVPSVRRCRWPYTGRACGCESWAGEGWVWAHPHPYQVRRRRAYSNLNCTSSTTLLLARAAHWRPISMLSCLMAISRACSAETFMVRW